MRRGRTSGCSYWVVMMFVLTNCAESADWPGDDTTLK